MRHVLLILFLFLFLSSTSFAISKKEAIYQEGDVLHEWTTEAGYHLAWMECASGGFGERDVREIKNQVAQLSWPDFKALGAAESSAERNPPQKVGFNCNSGVNKYDAVKAQLKNYVTELKLIILTSDKQIASTSEQKKIYCQRPNGTVYTKYESKDRSLAAQCGIVSNLISKSEYEKILAETASTSGKYWMLCVDNEAKVEKLPSCSQVVSTFNIEDFVNGQLKKDVNKTVDGWDIHFQKRVKEDKLYYVFPRGIDRDLTAWPKRSREEMCQAIWDKEWTEVVKFKLKTYDPSIYENVFCSLLQEEFDEEEKKQKELAEQKQFEDQQQRNKELQEAQNYINDLLAYIKTYPSTFDIIAITEFMVTNKNVLDGSWSGLDQEGFKLFKNYTESSKDFLTFHATQNDIRAKEALNRLTTAENEVKRYINYFTFYLQNNVTSKLAPGVLDNIKLAEATLETKDLGLLDTVNQEFNTYITDNSLAADYRKFIESVSVVATETKKKEETKKADTTLISSREDFKKAQTHLKKLGFYDGVIDGLFGSKSTKALNQWQEESNLVITSSITVDLLTTLEKHASASTQEIPKQEEIVDSKATEQTMYDEEQQAAQDYILDLFEFIVINPDTFDIIQITELITVNKAILNNKWNEVQQKDFALLKEFAATSEDFSKFHATQNDKRQKDILNEIALQNSKLKNIISYFKYYLKNNFASDIALSVIKNIKFAETSLEDQNLGALNNANAELEAFIANNNLTKDYTKYVKSLSSSDQEQSTITASTIDAIDLVNFDFIKRCR